MDGNEQDNAIRRRRSNNKELTDAPASAHVTRTRKNVFPPEAQPTAVHALGRWRCGGLNFVAFGKSFDAFEAQLTRVVGAEEGIADALSDLPDR
ncbi:MAG TPA: hypothetical protein VFK65_22110 [Candidatus Binatia bacterium]|nr:hypothetical protein [Candidatus Binatia bacterium]